MHSISGKITTDSGSPVEHASAHILNTNFGTLTNDDGTFAMEDVPPGKYSMEISAVGYATERRDILVSTNGVELSVELSEITTQLEAVIVTADKREEDLQIIPSSVTALSSRQVEQYRLWNSKDITAIVPNLYSADPGDGRNVTSIRGITSTSYDPAVATYVDGVNQFGLDTYISQLLDVERIEVLRGPQGTLYGRNAMGGVINIITKQPTNITKGFAEVNVGNYGQQRYAFGFRTPLIKNKLFFGMAGVYDRSNGFYKNLFDNSNFDKKYSLTGNYYLKYLAGQRWTFTMNIKNNTSRNSGAFPLSDSAFIQPFTVNQNAIARMIDNTFNSSVTINYIGKDFNLSSQTAYQSNYRYYKSPLDVDFSPNEYAAIFNNFGKDWNNVKVFTQEFKISSPASTKGRLHWIVGAYLYNQHNPVKQAIQSPYVIPTGFSIGSSISTNVGSNEGTALYGQATYTFFRKLDLTAGLRYDYEHKALSVLGQFQPDANQNSNITIQPDTASSVSYYAISPKVNLSYRITDNNLIFTSYNRGFRTGGLTQASPDPSQPPLYSYKPEYSNNIEVGVKNTFFDNRFRLNLTAFYVQVNNAQVPTLVLPSAMTITRNTGSLTSKGIEVEMAGTLLKGLQIEYNAGINDAKYTSLNLSKDGHEVNLKGNHQLFTPATTSMLAVQYDRTVGAIGFFVRGEWQYLGNQYFDLANAIRQSAYSLVNTRVGMSFHTINLSLWCRNLTDRKYISYAYDFGAEHLGNPKNYGVTIRFNF